MPKARRAKHSCPGPSIGSAGRYSGPLRPRDHGCRCRPWQWLLKSGQSPAEWPTELRMPDGTFLFGALGGRVAASVAVHPVASGPSVNERCRAPRALSSVPAVRQARCPPVARRNGESDISIGARHAPDLARDLGPEDPAGPRAHGVLGSWSPLVAAAATLKGRGRSRGCSTSGPEPPGRR